MFAPALIDRDFVPYTKRPVLRRNAALFVDGSGGRGHGAARVVPQLNCVSYCKDRTTDGLACGANCAGTCSGPVCVI